MKTIFKTIFLILLGSVALSSLNAGMPEIRSEESKIRTEISGLRGNNLTPEVLEAIIEKIQTVCSFIEKGINSLKGHDRMAAAQALGRLETDLTFLKAILGHIIADPSGENKTILASFANSSSRYNMLLKKLNISLD